MKRTLAISLTVMLVLVACDDATEELTNGVNDEENDAAAADTHEEGLQQLAAEICAEVVEEESTSAAREASRRGIADAADPSDRPALQTAVEDECGAEIRAIGAPPEPEPDRTPTYVEPTEDDFLLDLVILEQRCFGSAGCNVTFRVELSYLGFGDFDPNTVYELTYEIVGGEDIQINTMTIEGDQYSAADRERISTDDSEAELRAEVMSLRRR